MDFSNRDLAASLPEGATQLKVFDDKVSGLYASKTKSGVTFSFKYFDRVIKKQRTTFIGVFVPGSFQIEQARIAAGPLYTAALNKKDVAGEKRRAEVKEAGSRMRTFDEVADGYIKYVSTEVRKPNGSYRARKESWKKDISTLRRPRAAFGAKLFAEITAGDIATLYNGIVEERHAPLANNVRQLLFSVWRWATEPEQDYVEFNILTKLSKREPTFHKDRFLTEDEIRVLWHGLDRDDLPCDRHVALALKLILTTALRPGEVVGIQRTELSSVKGVPVITVPSERTKKRRANVQPQNLLSQEIIAEALSLPSKGGRLFASGERGGVMNTRTLSVALRGLSREAKKGCWSALNIIGICEFLGMEKFTPHDLRRTAATILGEAGVDLSFVGMALDHQEMSKAALATGKTTLIYQQAKRKVPTLNTLDTELRRILGLNTVALKLAA